jgi:hypothetical protein
MDPSPKGDKKLKKSENDSSRCSSVKGENVLNFTFSLSLFLRLYSPLDPGRFISFLILYTAGRTPWTRDQPVARPLLTQRTTQKKNERTQTFMPRVRFEPTIPVF